MSDSFNIAFADNPGELHWFTLSSTALTPISVDVPDSSGSNDHSNPTPSGVDQHVGPLPALPQDVPNILVLPATAGLPFQIELSFADPVKVARVIPQLAADQYAEINENWLFSWNISTKTVGEPCYLVSGIAFPPEFSPSRLAPAIVWRLAVPDFLLAGVEQKAAIRISTPVSEYLGLFSAKNSLQRVISDRSLPIQPILAASGLGNVFPVSLQNNCGQLFSLVGAAIEEPAHFDLSGFQQQLVGKNLRLSASALVGLLLGLVFIGHFFLWFEVYLTEAAAERTRISSAQAFSKVFPGVPVVDAVSQIRRKISEAQTSLNEAGSIPNVDWLSIFRLIEPAAASGIKLARLQSRADGFRIQGSATDYTSLDEFRRKIEASGVVEKVALPESRKVGDEVVFAMEAKWKS